MACFFDVTFLPEPLFRVPFLRSSMTFFTFLEAFLEYLRAMLPVPL